MHLKVSFLFLFLFSVVSQDLLHTCSSKVYCNDDILSVVQLSGIFNDSKTFVDMPIKTSVSAVLSSFQALPSPPNNEDILVFILENFDYPGSDIESWTPSDWSPTPPALANIVDQSLSDWSYALNDIWKQLGRTTKAEVQENPDLHSILPMQHGFIVPGGRFREFYYWDTYWIINGLLSSGMFDTVNGILQNFVSMIDTFGFIPNGARIYYSERTQPPFFTQMVWEYYKASITNSNLKPSAINILQEYVSSLDKEYQFWMKNRTMDVTFGSTTFILNRYNAHSNLPRPEGYAEDIQTATEAGIQNTQYPQQIYRDLASGAESGWDFSSRWFSNYLNLTDIHTSDLIPVDLNCILYKNEITLYNIHTMLNNTESAKNYLTAAQNRKNGIEKVLWNDNVGLWVDFNGTSGTQRSVATDHFYASSFVPLWANLYWDGLTTGSYSPSEIESKFLAAISSVGMLDYVGGLPTSMMKNTDQQWDFPNGWAPLQLFAIHGLRNLGNSGAELAAALASEWLQNNYNGWISAKQMFEKYNVTSTLGVPGEGGEYTVQSGFGWTNGAIFELLLSYCTNNSCIDGNGNIQVPVLYESSSSDGVTGKESDQSHKNLTFIIISCLAGSLFCLLSATIFAFFLYRRKNIPSYEITE